MTQIIQTLDDKERPLNPEHVEKRTKKVSQCPPGDSVCIQLDERIRGEPHSY